MIKRHLHRYSKYIRPISILLDLLICVGLTLFIFKDKNFDLLRFTIYLLAGWFVVAFYVKFYQVYRFTHPLKIFSKIIQQETLFFLIACVYFPFTPQASFDKLALLNYISINILLVTFAKFLLFYLLKEYRIYTGSNFRSTIIVGYNHQALELKKLFETKVDYGYVFLGFFSDRKENNEILGKFEDIKSFVIKHNVDEIYCSLNDLSNEKLKDLVDFMNENKRVIKFIPEAKDLFSKKLKVDYYELFPVLSIRNSPLNEPEIQILKRVFDLILSILIIVFVLSWLIPVLGLLIKLESRGPVFFKQGRPGKNQEEFYCYKFRSMVINKFSEDETIKNDPRITKIGQFMRKTSIDELPQFFNVLLGDMSIVGPRPQLWAHNNAYKNKIKKYFIRDSVKPGITGLAQISGYRGEINNGKDMENRIKYDVFYIENWSLFLDIKIIFQTIISICKGDEKAF